MTLASSDSIEIRPYRPADLGGITAVLGATYGEHAPPARFFERWACDCPSAQSGFFVATLGERVIGLQPMHVARFGCGMREFRGAVLAGVAVHPDFRRRGIFSALISACEQEAWRQDAHFVLTMPNEKSLPGFIKLDYRNLGPRTLFLRPVLRIGGWRRAGLGLKPDGEVVKAEVFSTSGELDDFLGKCCAERAVEFSELEDGYSLRTAALGLRRGPEWYRWRYSQNPMHSYRGCALFRSGRLVGLAIFRDERRRGIRITYLMDFVHHPHEQSGVFFRSLLPPALESGCSVLATITSSRDLGKVLSASRFHGIPGWIPLKKFHTVAKFNPQSCGAFEREFSDVRSWYLTPGDWDTL